MSAEQAVAGEKAIRLSNHPRASRQIELVRSWGGIGSFAFVGLLSLQANVGVPMAIGRALLAGIVGYVAGWGLSVLVWRHLVLAEAEAARLAAEQRRSALLEEIERRSAAVATPEMKP